MIRSIGIVFRSGIVLTVVNVSDFETQPFFLKNIFNRFQKDEKTWGFEKVGRDRMQDAC
jgi:hypothetical protein